VERHPYRSLADIGSELKNVRFFNDGLCTSLAQDYWSVQVCDFDKNQPYLAFLRRLSALRATKPANAVTASNAAR